MLHDKIYNAKYNSTLRVERRKWGNAGEREGRCTRSKVIASCRAREWEPEAEGQGFSPREITLSRDHLRRSAANFTRVCMTAFASRYVYYFTRWGRGNWRLEWLQWVSLVSCGWWAGRGREYRWREARGSGRSPSGVQGRSSCRGFGGRAPRLSRNELKMFYAQILSRNEAGFVKIRNDNWKKKITLH